MQIEAASSFRRSRFSVYPIIPVAPYFKTKGEENHDCNHFSGCHLRGVRRRRHDLRENKGYRIHEMCIRDRLHPAGEQSGLGDTGAGMGGRRLGRTDEPVSYTHLRQRYRYRLIYLQICNVQGQNYPLF